MDGKAAAAKAAGWLQGFVEDGGYSSNYISELEELYDAVLCATQEQRRLLDLLQAMLAAEPWAGLACGQAAYVAKRLCLALGVAPEYRAGGF